MISTFARSHTSGIGAFVAFMTAIAIPLRISGVSAQQLALGLAFLAAVLLAVCHEEIRKSVRQATFSLVGKLILIVFVLWGALIPFSLDPLQSLEIGGRTGAFLLAALIVGAALKSFPEQHTLMWKVFVGGAVGLGVCGVASFVGDAFILKILLWRVGEVVHPQYALKAYATASVCMLPVVVFAGRHLGGRWVGLSYSYAAICLALILLTQTRSAMAGLMVTIVFAIFLAVFFQKKYIKRAFILIFALVAATLIWVRYDRFVYTYSFTDETYLPGWLIDPHRQQIWKFAFERFLDHPFVGNGIDQLNRLPGADQIIEALGSTAHVVPSHPHNWVMEILSETGLIGFGAVALAVGALLFSLVKDFVKTGNEAAYAQILLLVGFWTCSLFSFSIWAVWWQLVLYILFAMLYVSKKHEPSV